VTRASKGTKPKRFDRAPVSFLTLAETDALLAAPDPGRWEGRRDRALLTLAAQTGLRLSELTGLTAPAHVRCTGKGRKQRCVPLTPAAAAILRTWLRERGNHPDQPLFPPRTGRRLSDDAVERRVAIHTQRAAQHCPSLASKNVTPNTLRQTAVISPPQLGGDVGSGGGYTCDIRPCRYL
jgi:site-specific recombinase XerC